ncbi:MAG TPA: alkaline phosphatase family protein [Ktedonobacteraceae bacterium]|nr:alkaline phosphatase family protein [Ktedonobacteraceae bacterium]
MTCHTPLFAMDSPASPAPPDWTVLVSPLIKPGTVCREENVSLPPFDHTSILKTVETRWDLKTFLTECDKAASSVGHVLTLDPSRAARTEDVLQHVYAPQAPDCHPGATGLSHLQRVHAEYVAQLPIPDRLGSTHPIMPVLHTEEEYIEYIRSRMAEWEASQRRTIP